MTPTARTKFRRKHSRGSYDAATIHAILDEALVCHVGLSTPTGPLVLPTTHVRVGEQLYIHGAAASHFLDTMIDHDVCVEVTLLDALVFARTAFAHSVNYRSVVVFGTARLVEDLDEKRRVLDALVDKLSPGRAAACRPGDPKELAATKVIAVAISEASAKARTGPPTADEGADAQLPYWAGIVPIHTVRGAAETAPDCQLAPPV